MSDGLPWVGLSLLLEDDLREAVASLFAAGDIDAIEWSFDVGWSHGVPTWAEGLLDYFVSEGRLFGHGVHYSMLSARWEDRQQRWLDALSREVARRRYVHVTEHYGFMTADPFVRGAPLPVPHCYAARRVAHDRLRRLRDIAGCPVGIENLALAWNRGEVLAQGPWLEGLLGADDFLLLDLHNLYCQMVNFDVSAKEMLDRMPLGRIRELHVSGGSMRPAWPASKELVRCDTHDERIPEPIFALLRDALDCCPNLQVVIVERLGGTLASAGEVEQLRDDFRRVKAIVAEGRSLDRDARPAPKAAPRGDPSMVGDDEVEVLARFQSALLTLLASELSLEETRARLEQVRSLPRSVSSSGRWTLARSASPRAS